jgi:hypothetical protein
MQTAYVLISAAALLGLCVVAATALKGWQGWLALKLREIEQRQPAAENASITGQSGMTSRIEIADLKERIRKLEAIAAGVDL